jgi:uncharacterized protein (DUF433 family)
MATKTLDEHIEINPAVAGGKPRIAGHRITVQNIVVWHERLGRNIDEIAADYDLTLSDIHAALAYYFDHQAEIDKSIADDEGFAEALRKRSPSKVAEKLEERARNGGAN